MSTSQKPSAFQDYAGLLGWSWNEKTRQYLINVAWKIRKEKVLTATDMANEIQSAVSTGFPKHENVISDLFNKFTKRDKVSDNIKYTKIYLWAAIKYPEYLDNYPEELLPKNHKPLSEVIGLYKEFERINHDIRDHSITPIPSYHLPDEIRVHEQSRTRDGYDASDSNNDGFSMNFEGNADNSGGGGVKFGLKYFSKMPNIAIILGVVLVAVLLLGYSRNSITTTGDCSPGSISGANSGIEINCD